MREWGLTPPQWRDLSDEDREEMLQESALVCPSCGNLRSVCSVEGGDWYPQQTTCYATAVRELVVRKVHKKYSSEPGTSGLHPLDGVSIAVSEVDLDPDDDFFD